MSRPGSETDSSSGVPPGPSTFGERFRFARDRQRVDGRWQEDQELAALVGLKPSQITEYKSRHEAPPTPRVLAIARVLGVRPGWLAFGDAGDDPKPEGFDTWLRHLRQRDGERREREERIELETRSAGRGRAEVHYGTPAKAAPNKKPAQKRGRAS